MQKKTVSDKVKIGGVETKNRIAVPPMVMFHWADDTGIVTEKHIRHYSEMAAGGAGLIICEATAVTKRSRLHESNLGLWDDSQIEGFKKITDAIHAHGVPCFVQLLHAGVNGIEQEAETASDCTLRPFGELEIHGHEMSRERIEETTEDFVKAAIRAKKAGFDGIELHGCHGYLFSQFMNRNINKRTDEYNAESCLFTYEVLKAIKDSCGADAPDVFTGVPANGSCGADAPDVFSSLVRPWNPDGKFAVGIRLSAFEPDLDAGLEHAKKLAPVCDFLDISYGWNDGMKPEKPEGFPYKEAFYGAMKIKEALPDMPVFAVDCIKNGDDVRGALDLTGIDMADVARGFLVNPDFGNAVLNGTPTGRCLNCKPACHYSPFMNDGTVDCPGRKLFEKENEKTE